MQRMRTAGLAFSLAVATLATPGHAAGHIIGADDDEEDDEKPAKKPEPPKPTPPSAPPAKDAKGKKKPADPPAAAARPEPAKPEPAKPEPADPSDGKKGAPAKPVDVLEPTAADKVRAEKEHKDSEARAAAAFAAEEAARKDEAQKATEKRRLDDEKKASDTKRRAETREQRLTTARKVRHLARKVGSYRLLVALEPGASAATTVLEVRVSLTKKLEVADARFGLLEPEPGASLIANVREANGKDVLGRSYVMHPMETPGSYGFHTTPLRAGLVNVTVRGTAADGTAIDATLPVHVGTWPPPDFDDEEKNNAALREEGKQASTAGGEN